MRKSGYCDSCTIVYNVNGHRNGFHANRNSQSVYRFQVELVDLVAVEGEEDMDAGRGIVAANNRIDGSQKDIRLFLVNGHDYYDFRRRTPVQDVVD